MRSFMHGEYAISDRVKKKKEEKGNTLPQINKSIQIYAKYEVPETWVTFLSVCLLCIA